MNSKQLNELAMLVEQFNGTLKISNNSVNIVGISVPSKEILSEKIRFLEISDGHNINAPNACIGKPYCPRAQQDTLLLGRLLDSMVKNIILPGKLTIGISGCPNCCSEVFVKDMGLFATAQGFTLVIGGSSGRKACAGRIIADKLSHEKCISIIREILSYYQQCGNEKERLGDMLERVGVDTLKLVISI
ncbi:nitrite reductase [Desulfitobacterium sp. AusDCA]